MKSLLKYIEILFFIFINGLFISGLADFYLIISFLGWFFVEMQVHPTIEEQDDFIFAFAFLILIIFMLLFVLKIIIFPVLYKMKNIFPTIHYFFDRFRDEIKFKIIVFAAIIILPIIIDVVFIKLKFSYVFFNELIFGLGLLPSYVVMYIYLKLKNKKQSS